MIAPNNQWAHDEFHRLAKDAGRIHELRLADEGATISPELIRKDVFMAWLLCAVPAGNC